MRSSSIATVSLRAPTRKGGMNAVVQRPNDVPVCTHIRAQRHSSSLLPAAGGPRMRHDHSASLISGPLEGWRRMAVATRKPKSCLCSSNRPLRGVQGGMGRCEGC